MPFDSDDIQTIGKNYLSAQKGLILNKKIAETKVSTHSFKNEEYSDFKIPI